MNSFKKNHIKLITSTGGTVSDDTYVTKPGVAITKVSALTDAAKLVFETMNINTQNSEAEQSAEFNSRITYLSFKDEKDLTNRLNSNMVNKFQHLSVYNDEYITFLISGTAVETELEFIAHNEASVARLTSSKTNAQNEPLYKLISFDTSEEMLDIQKTMILKNIEMREELVAKHGTDFLLKNKNNREVFNLLNIGSKAVSFTITMSLKEWHKTLIGRLSHSGVELDMLEIMEMVAGQLKDRYPEVIKTIPEYYEMGNGKKYE